MPPASSGCGDGHWRVDVPESSLGSPCDTRMLVTAVRCQSRQQINAVQGKRRQQKDEVQEQASDECYLAETECACATVEHASK